MKIVKFARFVAVCVVPLSAAYMAGAPELEGQWPMSLGRGFRAFHNDVNTVAGSGYYNLRWGDLSPGSIQARTSRAMGEAIKLK